MESAQPFEDAPLLQTACCAEMTEILTFLIQPQETNEVFYVNRSSILCVEMHSNSDMWTHLKMYSTSTFLAVFK